MVNRMLSRHFTSFQPSFRPITMNDIALSKQVMFLVSDMNYFLTDMHKYQCDIPDLFNLKIT